jgi:hypothetical protein
MTGAVGVEPWDTEWAYEQACKALEWLAEKYPECSGAEGLKKHDKAADEAAAAGDREAYLKVLRAYCRAGRDEALRGFGRGQRDGPLGRARPAQESEEEGQGGRRTLSGRVEGGLAPAPRGRGGRQESRAREEAYEMSAATRDEIMFAIPLFTAVGSACLYVAAVRYRAWGAVWSFGITLFVFGILAVVLFARLLWEAT